MSLIFILHGWIPSGQTSYFSGHFIKISPVLSSLIINVLHILKLKKEKLEKTMCPAVMEWRVENCLEVNSNIPLRSH